VDCGGSTATASRRPKNREVLFETSRPALPEGISLIAVGCDRLASASSRFRLQGTPAGCWGAASIITGAGRPGYCGKPGPAPAEDAPSDRRAGDGAPIVLRQEEWKASYCGRKNGRPRPRGEGPSPRSCGAGADARARRPVLEGPEDRQHRRVKRGRLLWPCSSTS
jgi:hypothetical protein